MLGVGTAFLVTRTDLPGRRVFGVLAALPLAVPTYVAGFAWVSTVDGFAGFWAGRAGADALLVPVRVPAGRGRAGRRRPGAGGGRPARSAAAPGGPSPRVTLRQVRPAVAAGALLVALYVLSDFGAVSILRVDTFTRAIFTAFNLGFDRTGALVLSTVLVALTVAAARRRAAHPRAAAPGTPGSAAPAGRRPGCGCGAARGGRPCAALAAVAALALGVPAASLARWLAEGVSRPGSLGRDRRRRRQLAGRVARRRGADHAARAAGRAARRPRARPARRRCSTGSPTSRTPCPASSSGCRWCSSASTSPTRSTRRVWLLALAYAALFLPLAVGAVAGAAAQAPPALEEVARSLGRGPAARVRARSPLPLTAPGIGAGAALVFLTCMKELPATLLLRPDRHGHARHRAVDAHLGRRVRRRRAVRGAAGRASPPCPTWLLAARTGADRTGQATVML